MIGNAEADVCDVLTITVVLPDGDIKRDVLLSTENTVREEKERLLREANIPYPNLYVMVVYGPHGSYTVMDDKQLLETYSDSLAAGAECEVHIRKKNSQVERPARSVKPELFNINLK